jgi:CBS domain-containing protein
MQTIRQMLRTKTEVYAVRPDTTVYEALRLMADRNVGAVMVVLDGEILGVFSERDYARKGILRGLASKDTPVSALMSAPAVTISPSVAVTECMALMTEKRIRHLPVVENGHLVGVISIGDVVRALVDEQQFTIQALQSYIATA